MGIHVTTIVFDISGFINVKHDSMQGELLEYSISMLREMFEYFEVKRIPYCLYTNARSSYIHENVFRSTPSGKKTRRIMLSMLGELSVDFNNKKYPLKSKELPVDVCSCCCLRMRHLRLRSIRTLCKGRKIHHSVRNAQAR